MKNLHTAGTGLVRAGYAWACLLMVASLVGCRDGGEPARLADPVRPVKTFVVSAPGAGAGIQLPGEIQPASPVDLAFEEVSGQIVELPIAGREGQQVLEGELLAQIEPEGFRNALQSAEANLYEAYSALDLARAENERMEKMKGINPDLVTSSMLARTQENLEQAEARQSSRQAEVDKAENLLENSSLRAPFAGIIVRCLVEDAQEVQADEPVVRLQDINHVEMLVEAPEPLLAEVREIGWDNVSAVAGFPMAPGKEFPLKLKEEATAADPATGAYRVVLEMEKPNEIELPPGATATVSLSGTGNEIGTGPVLIPAIAVTTDPDGKDYVWLVDTATLRVHRQEVRIGRLAGTDQIQVSRGLGGGERIVVAGVTRLAEGQRVRLWEDQEAGETQ